MSYDIYIGEATPKYPDPSDGEDGYFGWSVPSVSLPNAPTFPGDNMTGQSNGRHPGYSQWTDFCGLVGLYDMFFDRSYGLLRSHPGIQMLICLHLGRVKEARRNWEAKHPGMIPGWDPECTPFSRKEPDPKYDNILPRLIWLEFWIDWAITNCKHPAMSNL